MKIAEITIKLRGLDREAPAKIWIEKVYNKYPTKWENNHVMLWGKQANQQLALFELIPVGERQVHIKWFQAVPQRESVGKRAMQVLQQLASDDNISLSLYPWSKGKLSQAALKRIYSKMGFKTNANSEEMFWEPAVAEVSTHLGTV
jgi:hypothetical protein